MRRLKKKYSKPFRPWDEERLIEEKKMMKKYGLKRKKELWVSEAILRKFRRMAREAAAKNDENLKNTLIKKLYKLGILEINADLASVLNLTVEDILKRRLQTILFNKNLAKSIKHARQLITHKKVFIGDRIVPFPSYLVGREEENYIRVSQ
ncbi:MAG: 30S ribosomal protein S4 [Candidatus Aenigmarchaeota archaeon]|nr:30S ribosomal protein S4 [Candidatus Aenigmarchaeota archaeon]MDW8149678.1 30S ribosomal protein S4 [Candidatus Aenigmarchaeota archaeon]